MAHLATGILDCILTCSVQPGKGPVDAGLDALAFAWLSREWVALPGYMWPSLPPPPNHFTSTVLSYILPPISSGMHSNINNHHLYYL